jgi:3-oxoadipate enol-lactonase
MWFGATTARERPELIARVRATLAEAPAAGVAAAVRALMTRPDRTRAASSYDGPALLVSGAEDALTPPPLQQAMHAVMPRATLEVIEHAGHLASLERPGEFNAILQRFLHSLDG